MANLKKNNNNSTTILNISNPCDSNYSCSKRKFSNSHARPLVACYHRDARILDMSEISESIQSKCLAFGDRVIKLNDYLLSKAANAKPLYKMVGGKRVYEKAVPVYLQSISVLCNQLLRAGTSISANNAEAISAISKADFKSKTYIALKEAREVTDQRAQCHARMSIVES